MGAARRDEPELTMARARVNEQKEIDRFASSIYRVFVEIDPKKSPKRDLIWFHKAIELAKRHKDYPFADNMELIQDIHIFCHGTPWIIGRVDFEPLLDWWRNAKEGFKVHIQFQIDTGQWSTAAIHMGRRRFQDMLQANDTVRAIIDILSNEAVTLPTFSWHYEYWNAENWFTAATLVAQSALEILENRPPYLDKICPASHEVDRRAIHASPAQILEFYKCVIQSTLPPSQLALMWGNSEIGINLHEKYLTILNTDEKPKINDALYEGRFFPRDICTLIASYHYPADPLPEYRKALHMRKATEERAAANRPAAPRLLT